MLIAELKPRIIAAIERAAEDYRNLGEFAWMARVDNMFGQPSVKA